MKFLPVPAELLLADRQTDRQKDGRTERQIKRYDEVNTLFSQLCEHANRGNILVNIHQRYTKHSKKRR